MGNNDVAIHNGRNDFATASLLSIFNSDFRFSHSHYWFFRTGLFVSGIKWLCWSCVRYTYTKFVT